MRRLLVPVRWWVWLYTLGLPPSSREERRAELESDLWEHWGHQADLGLGDIRVAGSIWSRWLLGIPDDLAWRAEMTATPPTEATASRARLMALSTGLTVAVGLVLLVVVINTARFDQGTQPGGLAAVVLLLLASCMAVLGIVVAARGHRVMAARPAEGAVLVVGGSLVAGLAWYWLLLPVAIAMAVSMHGLWRAAGVAHAASKARRPDGPEVPGDRH